jgi:hypothetical protein
MFLNDVTRRERIKTNLVFLRINYFIGLPLDPTSVKYRIHFALLLLLLSKDLQM